MSLVLLVCCGEHESTPLTTTHDTRVPLLEIAPKGRSLSVGESLRFTASLQEKPVSGVTWLASGGLIDQSGLFLASDQAGTYQVRAEVDTPQGLLTDVTSGIVVPRDEAGLEDDPPTPDSFEDPSILLADDFEENHFRRWSGLAPASDPRWNGTGEGGAHIGNGYISSEQVHSGELAWKALVDPTRDAFGKAAKSSLESWTATRDVSDFYISAWYFIPSDYPAVSSLIMQIKSAGSGYSRKPVAFRVNRDRQLVVFSGILNRTLQKTGVQVPVGRWFNLTGRFVIADFGLVEMWLDGQKLASVRTDTKDNQFAYPGVGNYVDSLDYPVTCHIYVDDVMITTNPPS